MFKSYGMIFWLIIVAAVLYSEPVVTWFVGDGYDICGPWGCSAPLSSLMVWHGFVAMVVVPFAVVMAGHRPVAAAKYGLTALVVTGVVAAVWSAPDAVIWWRQASEFSRSFVGHRLLFSLVAFTDVPVVPMLLAVIAYWWAGRRNRPREMPCEGVPSRHSAPAAES